MVTKVSKGAKLELIPNDELDPLIISAALYPGKKLRNGRFLWGERSRWADSLFDSKAEDVQLPEEAQQMINNVHTAVDADEVPAPA